VVPTAASAQEPELEIEVDNPEGEPPPEDGQPVVDQPIVDPEPEIDITVEADKKDKDEKEIKLGEEQASWQDVVVVIRKPFLKQNRAEIVPSWGVTLNDNMIRHYQFDAQLNYYLTDVLAVGVEAQYFVKDLLEPYELVARQYRRLPTLNQYNFGAALNFHYAPIYAKFAVLNGPIVHWETYFTAGVGFTQSEVLPRDPALPGWTNFLITPNVGIATRVFVTKFVTLNLGVRDYVFVDKFEDVTRTEEDPDAAKDNADGKLINHIVFQVGLSFWFPPTFRYTTFR
jgi:outer membrane beta-barrel protein